MKVKKVLVPVLLLVFGVVCVLHALGDEMEYPIWWPAPNVLCYYEDGTSEVVQYYPPEPLPADQTFLVGATFPFFKTPLWAQHNYGLITEASRLGLKVNFQNPGSYTEISRQIDIVDSFLARKVDGIFIASVSYNALVPVAESAQAEGIPVIAVANDLNTTAIQSRVVCTYDYIGERCGQYIVEHLPNGGKVSFFPGPAGASWSEQMEDGFLRATKGHNNIQIVATKWGNMEKDIQHDLVEVTLERFPDVDYIFGNELAAICARDILQTWPADKAKPGILSCAFMSGIIDAIKEGTIEAVALEPLALVEFIAAGEMVKHLSGWYDARPWVKIPLRIIPLPSFVTQENLDEVNWIWVKGPDDWTVVWGN